MNAATPFPWPAPVAEESGRTTFRAIFEHAPVAVARCNAQGVIVDINPAFMRILDHSIASRSSLRLGELVSPQDREKAELLLSDLLASRRDQIGIEGAGSGVDHSNTRWTAWREPGRAGEPDHALLIAERAVAGHVVCQHVVAQHVVAQHVEAQAAIAEPVIAENVIGKIGGDPVPAHEGLLQTQRWEAVGRLAGGVVHDFNNLLTGVMLYCDLLLSTLDARDLRRRYADEIRSAIVQATGLVRQLLVFARPQAAPTHPLCLNDVAAGMQDLLVRLMGENIALELRLDAGLGLVKIDQAQAQQIVLNLVLNARDAMPQGGRITVETSNCNFQPVASTMASEGEPVFPCVLLVVGDNGHGMNAETRQRLFEPFFTTKNAGKGTGLGLTTVRSIVTTNHGLIHFESEPGRGTRAMILLPRATVSADPSVSGNTATSDDAGASSLKALTPTQFQEIKKESLL